MIALALVGGVAGAVAEAIVDEGKAETIGSVFVIIPVVELGGGEVGRGLHSYIQDSGCLCHVCGVLLLMVSSDFGRRNKIKTKKCFGFVYLARQEDLGT